MHLSTTFIPINEVMAYIARSQDLKSKQHPNLTDFYLPTELDIF